MQSEFLAPALPFDRLFLAPVVAFDPCVLATWIMSAGQPVVPSGGGAAKPPDMSKNARGRNLALPEVLVACMAAGRANEECGELSLIHI